MSFNDWNEVEKAYSEKPIKHYVSILFHSFISNYCSYLKYLQKQAVKKTSKKHCKSDNSFLSSFHVHKNWKISENKTFCTITHKFNILNQSNPSSSTTHSNSAGFGCQIYYIQVIHKLT